jgi:translocator protein
MRVWQSQRTTPPNWIFPVVWNALYALMGVSLWLLWDRSPESNGRQNALAFFWIQLLLNAAWSPMFFGAHQLLLALIIILLMIVAVGATIAASWQVSRVAALLLVPYLAWISYATWLNAGVWFLNR